METKLGRRRQLKLVLDLDIQDESQDDLLDLALEVVEERVLAYLNRESLPPQLEHTLVLVAAGYCQGAGWAGTHAPGGAVTAVKRGDVTIDFGGAGATQGAFDLAGGDTFFGFREVLNGFRRVRG